MDKKIDPFTTETIILRVPIKRGDVTVSELNFRPPKIKDALRTDRYENGTVAAALALMSSLTGQPETLLEELMPEDYADCAVILARTNLRFLGQINLFDQQKEENNDPTKAETEAKNSQQRNSSPGSAA
jgi:hypothetical protein